MKQHNITEYIEKRYGNSSPLWFDFIILILCIGISYLKPVPFPWKVPLIAAILMSYIFYYHRSFEPLGMATMNWKKTVFWGGALAFIVVVGISNLLIPLIENLLQEEVDTSAYGALEGNLNIVVSLWWKAMISAAIAEEIFYRGFCFYFLERLIGSGTWQKVTIVLLTSVYFGLSHAFQGPTGVIGIMVASAAIGGVYYLSKRNLWAVILGHALIDTWALFSLYKGGINLFF